EDPRWLQRYLHLVNLAVDRPWRTMLLAFGTFDIVFCRNVLIYFDEKTKADILGRIAKQLAPDGFLFLGGAETVIGITEAFKPLPGQRGLYVHANSPHLAAKP
ncbi:MAG TPA: CheR family methyltransferase, partial [Alphaproteobacteria bacterium]|nr:CheR family methyltransferase [Alphaproteobacteria bacterium]